MLQLESLLPALGASGDGHTHGYWWIVLAIVVFAFVSPLAFVLGRHGGRGDI